MDTNNKLHLYIGLGEVGLQTIIQTKKMFINTYGEIPPFIDFLGISPQYSSRITKGRSICEYIDTDDTMVLRNYMNPEEYISVFSERDRKKLSWIPQSIQNCSGFYMNDAYILYRFGGRYEFIMHRDKISLRISQKIKDILRKNNATSSNVTVHVFFYTGCRFGAGMMIDLGYLLQELGLHNTQLHVMRGYDNINQHIQYTNAMTYATLCDLDYMNSLGLDNNVTFHYLDRDYTAQTPPYRRAYICDYTTNDIDEIVNKQSLILFATHQTQNSLDAIEDAHDCDYYSGLLDIGNKKAWARCSNVCEIVYGGGKIIELYKLNAAISIIDSILAPKHRIASIEDRLKRAKESIQLKIKEFQENIETNNSTFTIDITNEIIDKNRFDNICINTTDFINSIGGEAKLYGFDKYSIEDITNTILEYTSTLYFNNQCITDILNLMNCEEIGALIEKCVNTLNESQHIDYVGYKTTQYPRELYMVYTNEPKIFEKLPSHFFHNDILNTDPYVFPIQTNLKDRIIIHKQTLSFPIYAIKNNDNSDYFNRETESLMWMLGSDCRHFDMNVYAQLKAEGWSIFPKQPSDNESN